MSVYDDVVEAVKGLETFRWPWQLPVELTIDDLILLGRPELADLLRYS